MRSLSGHGRRQSAATLERYLLSLSAKPFIGTLAIVLPALLLERLLRLFDLLADTDVPTGSVGRMLLDLVPQYLGLALPAALFIGVYFVIARLSRGNELEAMQNAGVSMAWISRPFLLLGLALAIVAYGLYGYAQPFARYAYRAALWSATESGWNATIPPGRIIHVGRNLIVTADAADPGTGELRNVLIHQQEPDGTEEITTGERGSLFLTDQGSQLVLSLEDGHRLVIHPNGRVATITSQSTSMSRPFVLHLRAFRPRGGDEREMTTAELWRAHLAPHPTLPIRRLDGELYSRILRALSMAVLPLLAVSLGISGKRSRRQYGVLVGVLILILYDHAIQLTAALGTAGLIDPRLPLWGIFLAFTAFCFWMFARASQHTSEGPLDPLFTLLEDATDRAAKGLRGMALFRPRSRAG
ncbi:MAG TPA: LptF/LptG family permease [Acidisoma sp.]|uniref:LptF/LptG family permease n=1 Tax=Acidisoma sp. TaxID=1872115 RepID=UPI002B98DEF9|nr:LptF/LptG family permease [Acidisoma sp.]HTH99896.1 LptF/LptG family permease [Acidisoma sp.]